MYLLIIKRNNNNNKTTKMYYTLFYKETIPSSHIWHMYESRIWGGQEHNRII